MCEHISASLLAFLNMLKLFTILDRLFRASRGGGGKGRLFQAFIKCTASCLRIPNIIVGPAGEGLPHLFC
jgi:hypothetical protein